MFDYLIYFLCAIILLGVELLYFRIADHFDIIDHPNERSSHSEITLLGGGIIFPIGALLFFVSFQFQYPYFLLGLIAISLISFLDDVLTLNKNIRLTVQLMSVTLLFYQWDLYVLPWYWLVIGAIVVIGTINAYNFMDGINGITGLYSLSILISLMILNSGLHFINADFLIITLISILIFLYFNFRQYARCFAGDVGSISIAFILLFAIGSLILQTHQLMYILFLAVYGADSVLTIAVKLYNKQNIFEPHRMHLYQLLGNERGFSQRLISVLYAVLQLGINFVVMWTVKKDLFTQYSITFILFTALTISYFLIRYRIKKNYVDDIKT